MQVLATLHGCGTWRKHARSIDRADAEGCRQERRQQSAAMSRDAEDKACSACAHHCWMRIQEPHEDVLVGDAASATALRQERRLRAQHVRTWKDKFSCASVLNAGRACRSLTQTCWWGDVAYACALGQSELLRRGEGRGRLPRVMVSALPILDPLVPGRMENMPNNLAYVPQMGTSLSNRMVSSMPGRSRLTFLSWLADWAQACLDQQRATPLSCLKLYQSICMETVEALMLGRASVASRKASDPRHGSLLSQAWWTAPNITTEVAT